MIELGMKGPTLRLGVIGCGGRGRDHLRRLAAMPDVRIVAICDNWQPHLDRALADLWTGTLNRTTGPSFTLRTNGRPILVYRPYPAD